MTVEGLVDDNPEIDSLLGYPVFHGLTEDISPLIVSIGNNRIRKTIVERVKADFGKAVHRSAIVSPRCTLGEGTVVMQGAVVQIVNIIIATVIYFPFVISQDKANLKDEQESNQ